MLVVFGIANGSADRLYNRRDGETDAGNILPASTRVNTSPVRLRNDLTLSFYYFVSKLARDGTIRLSVLRAGKKLDLDVPVTTDFDYVMRPLYGALPNYLICGPVVFSTASQELVNGLTPYAASMWTAQSSPLLLRQSDLVRFEGEELVLMTAMLPHPLTQGYSGTIGRVVSQVNGVQIRNLRHLAETLRDNQERFIEIEFAERFVEELVFERPALLDAMDEILADNGIRHPCSAELRDVWNPEN